MGCFYSSNKTKGLCCGLRKRKKRKQFLEALAVEAKSSELLSCIPGRMCVNGSSRIASIFTQQGRKGTNQDAMIVWENFASLTDATFCGVFDGHGPFGHLVARKVRDSLPAKLVSQFKEQLQGEYDTMDLQNPDILKAWKDSFLGAYNVMDTELKLHPTIDSFCSGTTAVTLLLQGKDLVLANVGDSRAILGRRNDNNVLEAVQLTVDLKPNLPNEAERIKQFKGRVFALEDEPEVPRVWLPHDNSPGLAMARAFGDFCLKDFGLIAVPDISYHQIIDGDQFIVLASDGIWDVLSNKEVVDVVASAPTRTTAARALVETAVRAWRLKYPSSKIDDCAVVCLFLNQQQPFLKTVEHKINASSELFYTADNSRNDNNATDPKTVPGLLPPLTTLEDSSLPEMESDDSSSGGDEELDQEGEEDKNSPLLIEENCDIIKEEKIVERSHSRRSLAECLSAADDNEWSALEGVTRVNSLLNLPRFLVGDKRVGRGGSRRDSKEEEARKRNLRF